MPLLSTQPLDVHPDFNASGADLTVQASDAVLLKLHRVYLSATTGAFPGTEFDVGNENTHLTEPSNILAILFQFVYPKKHPDLRELDYPTVAGVAEAAEKYEVFAAMNICQLRMREFLPENAPEILAHAVKHGYYGLIDEVIPHLARQPLIQVLERLPLARVLSWVQFHSPVCLRRDAWLIMHLLYLQARYHQAWEAVFDNAIARITAMPQNTTYPGRCYDPNSICGYCKWSLAAWINAARNIQTLSILLAEVRTQANPRSNYTASTSTRLCPDCNDTCRHRVKTIQSLQDDIRKMLPFKYFL